MKYLTMIALMLALLLVGGCAQFQQALEAAEAAQADFEKAGEELREAYELAETARQNYIDALESGEADEIEAALLSLKRAEEERRARELDFSDSKMALENAEKRLEQAKAEGNYIETLLGLIGGAVFGVGGGFLGGKRSGRKQGLIEAAATEKK